MMVPTLTNMLTMIPACPSGQVFLGDQRDSFMDAAITDMVQDSLGAAATMAITDTARDSL